MCTLSKHAVTEFLVISFVQHTLAFITSLFLDRMLAQSRNFYENNMILRFVLSDPAKSSLKVVHGLMDTITRTMTHKKHYYYEKISPLFFSMQCIIKTHVIPQYTSCYFCNLGRHLGYFTTLKHNIMPVKFAKCNYCENYQKKGY